MMPLRARRDRAFTLIELMTVTGIIIVLATLFMSSIFTTMESGRQTNCRGNLSQLHKLINAYASTHGDYLPAFWHERWAGELGLMGGMWRPGITELKNNKPYIKYVWDQWALYLRNTAKPHTFPPDTGNTYWRNICARMYYIYAGGTHLGVTCKKIENPDDVNPLMPLAWNNYQMPGDYLGPVGGERSVFRSSAPVILCPSDISAYKCDQGGLISYMGLAKYGWWYRNTCDTTGRYMEYHQLQEVKDPSKGILLAETEPGTWQFGGCG